jgi:UDP-GlcNAc3NAcA epimerase
MNAQAPTTPKVLTVVGARPQFIKAAPVSRALAAAGIAEYLVHTGQHYDTRMSEVFFAELGIRPPDLNLSVGSGTHGAQTGAMLPGLESAMLAQQPDWVVVYGDTNSTLAGALAASKLHIPLAHVESGLRSYNRKMPEEINRVVADVLSNLLFIPTETARVNLAREGINSGRVVYSGDVMYDAMCLFSKRAESAPGILGRLGLTKQSFVLATIHRAENTDHPQRLNAAVRGLQLAAEHTRVVLPLHPRTRARLVEQGIAGNSGLEVIEPVGFLDMLRLEANAAVIATDSGGVQKEAFFQGVPCVTLRDETEWTELVNSGWNRLAPPVNPGAVAEAILSARGARGKPVQPYGDGHASEIIVETLLTFRS